MAKTVADVMKMVSENEVKFVDFRFTDTRGKEQHVSVPVSHFDEDKFSAGHAFDGSSIAGWKGIEASDMLLMPDPNTANIDPFFEEPTLILTCDVLEPSDGKPYERDPRSLARRAEAYLKSSGIGDAAFFGPEPEFFIFDQVQWNVDMSGCFVKVSSEEAPWSTGATFEGGNMGHRPALKGGYFPVPPVDSFQDMRSEMCLLLEQCGIPVEVHHHEVAAPGQNEIGTKFSTLVQRADWLQLQKYIIHNVAHAYGKTATFMPKPIVGDNGSGMHVHQSVWKDGKNLFAGDGYAGLSEFALFYIGGIIKHAR
ncbi:MAG: glutamine synthetase beta-grasp domain-containing protein, partial [Rubrivivax sp.]